MMKPSIEKASIPFWLRLKGSLAETQKLVDAAHGFWLRMIDELCKPSQLLDEETAPIEIVDLLAWERRITRLDNEKEQAYRLRVKHAFVNEKDAGSTAGIIRIFQRLGVESVVVEERIPGFDWDVVMLTFSGSQLSEDLDLLRAIVRLYGRTCRRYLLTTNSQPVIVFNQPASIANEFAYSLANLDG